MIYPLSTKQKFSLTEEKLNINDVTVVETNWSLVNSKEDKHNNNNLVCDIWWFHFAIILIFHDFIYGLPPMAEMANESLHFD